jgi:type I restriction enzyme S subunit
MANALSDVVVLLPGVKKRMRFSCQDSHFVNQFTSGCRESFFQRYTEMLLAWYFIQLGFLPKSKEIGTDLFIEHNGTRIWIEIITPELKSPSGDGIEAQKAAREINDYLAPPPTDPKNLPVNHPPHQQILLRWTAAIKDKKEKLTHYIENGVVKPEDVYVIAINSILLGRDGFTGISQAPNCIEATFAVGPIEININRETSEVRSAEPSYRSFVLNNNQSTVPTDNFLNPDYRHVSALMATHVGLEAATQLSPPSPFILLHNPHAVNPLPHKTFKTEKEYVAEVKGEFWEISNIVGN